MLCARFFAVVVLSLLTAPIAFAAPLGKPGQAQVVQDEKSVVDLLQHVSAFVRADGKLADDKVIQPWLDRTLRRIRDASAGHPVKQPLTVAGFNDVRPAGRIALPNRFLFVEKTFDQAHVSDSFIVADGDVSISHCSNSVIIANGVVAISHSRNNVVVARELINVGHDGNPMPAMKGDPAVLANSEGSTFITPGLARIGHTTATVIAAPRVEIAHARHCQFINTDKKDISHETECREAAAKDIVFGKLEDNGLQDVKVHWFASDKGAVFTYKGRRYAVDLREAIVDQDGKPVADMDGWVLTIAESDLAVLRHKESGASTILRTR